MRSVLRVHWKDWCWSWNSNILATSCEELTHVKRPWCWERLGAGGEGDDRGWDGWMASPTRWMWVWVDSGSWWWTGMPGVLWFMGVTKNQTRLRDWPELSWGWDGWMASPTQWTWVWVNSRTWWWTGRPGVLQSMGSQRVGHDWVTELNWILCSKYYYYYTHIFQKRNWVTERLNNYTNIPTYGKLQQEDSHVALWFPVLAPNHQAQPMLCDGYIWLPTLLRFLEKLGLLK